MFPSKTSPVRQFTFPLDSSTYSELFSARRVAMGRLRLGESLRDDSTVHRRESRRLGEDSILGKTDATRFGSCRSASAVERAERFSPRHRLGICQPVQGGRVSLSTVGRSTAKNHACCPAAKRAALGTGIGWHTFRHTYSTMLRHLRVDVKVQQELLRHADIHTTLNVYTQGVAEDLRDAHSRVVRIVITAQTM